MRAERIVKAGTRRRFDVSLDLTGRRIGSLVVLEETDKRYYNRIIWKCRCVCGKIVDKASSELLCPNSMHSCGCMKEATLHRKYCGDISGTCFGNIEKRAKQHNLEFNITKEYIWELFLSQNKRCAISGVDIHFRTTSYSKGNKSDQTASLDRIDSTKGYIVGNVQWVHKTINYMKVSLSDEDFIDWCNIVVNFQKEKSESNLDSAQ